MSRQKAAGSGQIREKLIVHCPLPSACCLLIPSPYSRYIAAPPPEPMMGPPADTLYAVDPLAVETMMPSPKYVTPASLSAEMESSTIRNGGPAVTTASLSAVATNLRCLAICSGLSHPHGASE